MTHSPSIQRVAPVCALEGEKDEGTARLAIEVSITSQSIGVSPMRSAASATTRVRGRRDDAERRRQATVVPPDASGGAQYGRERWSRVTPAQVVHISAECWPFARTGGLGEAVAGLVATQRREGSEAWVVVPLYRTARAFLANRGCELEAVGGPLTFALGNEAGVVVRLMLVRGGAGRGRGHAKPPWSAIARAAIFVECAAAFDRPGIYGEVGVDYADNAWRFAILCRAALQVLRRLRRAAGHRPVVAHAHDWHAALLPYFLHAEGRRDNDLRAIVRVLTVHNASFQGVFPAATLDALGQPGNVYDGRCAAWYGQVNLLKGALAVADRVTTVSPTHAAELRSANGGFGLHADFQALGERFVGICNGIDLAVWAPHPSALEESSDYEAMRARRCVAKMALQRRLGLAVAPALPLVAICSRLCAQKGTDFLLEAQVAARADLQLVVLGEGDDDCVKALRTLTLAHAARVALVTPFEDDAERSLLAGADMLLMPSRFEPCGLAQLHAQRFGVVPIAHRVGGLADTIIDGETGFVFAPYQTDVLHAALDRALAAYHDVPEWQRMLRACARADVGWSFPAARYEEVYHGAAAAARERAG